MGSIRWLPVTLLPTLILSTLPPPPAAAQEDARQISHIYEAYYKINYGDLPEWNRQFQAFGVPVLEALRSEGVIEGWGHWQHNVGSEYNVRFAVRVFDWASIDTFWDEYLGRTFASMPEAEQTIASRMIEAHHDEIWSVGPTRFAENGGAVTAMYASTFNVSFADAGEWDRIWSDLVLPILGEAMDAGVLNGVVLLNHNTGGHHNKKVLFLFEAWDDIDDMWAMFFERMEARHPEEFAKTLSMVRAHDDVIWSAPPPPNP